MSLPSKARLLSLVVLALATTLFGFAPCVAQQSAAGNREKGSVFRDCPRCPEMVVVPAGSIMMGSERLHEAGPRRRVTISSPFAVGVYEVTFAEWDACVDGGGCGGYQPPDLGWGRGAQPVSNVSWVDAQAYLEWLSSETGQEYRLLRVAEWEYVARAGTGVDVAWYSAETDAAPCRVARDLDPNDWHPDWVGCPGDTQTAPVGSLEPNAFGLHDVLGNAWEWTEDCRHDEYRWIPADSVSRPEDCAGRQLRGGSWYLVGGLYRGVYLDGLSIGAREPGVGLRVARAVTDRDGLTIDLVDEGYTELLFAATWNDSLDLVKALLDSGADPNAYLSDSEFTPFFAAVNQASLDTVRAFLEAGADPNATDKRGETPLYHALKEGPDDLEGIVAALLDSGAEVNGRIGDGRTPLHAAAQHRRSEAVISTLLDAGADTDLSALQLAALQNDSVAVASLLARSADLDEPDHNGWTPLHFAMTNTSPVTITSLLDAGADSNAVDALGDTPLIRYLDEAASDADPEGIVVLALLNGGADPNIADSAGRAPLHLATRYGVRPAVVSALLDAGADPNALDKSNDPPLINHLRFNLQATDDREGSVAVVEALLRGGAPIPTWAQGISGAVHFTWRCAIPYTRRSSPCCSTQARIRSPATTWVSCRSIWRRRLGSGKPMCTSDCARSGGEAHSVGCGGSSPRSLASRSHPITLQPNLGPPFDLALGLVERPSGELVAAVIQMAKVVGETNREAELNAEISSRQGRLTRDRCNYRTFCLAKAPWKSLAPCSA